MSRSMFGRDEEGLVGLTGGKGEGARGPNGRFSRECWDTDLPLRGESLVGVGVTGREWPPSTVDS